LIATGIETITTTKAARFAPGGFALVSAERPLSFWSYRSAMQAKRYYFHFSDLNRDLFERDWKGRICFSEDEASAYAHSMVRELSANSNLRGSMLIVSDDSGKKIETITL
jgi:hypothetical protein